VRGALLRTVIAFGIGIVVLGGILFYASTVDGRPPTVAAISLTQHDAANDALGLTTTSIEVDFSEPVETESAEAAFVIEPAVAGSYSWSGTTMTFSPDERLPLSTAFSVQLQAGVRDRAGNAMPDPSSAFDFTTVGHPSIVATDPVDGAQEVAQDAVIRLTFSTLMDTASVEDQLSLSPSTAVTLRWSGEQLTVEPVHPLREATSYTLRIGADARDQAGTPLGTQFRLAFSTVRTDLGVRAMIPADGLEGASPAGSIAVIFDRPIDPGSVSGDAITVSPSVAGSVEVVELPGAAGLSEPGTLLVRFVPSGPLDPNTTYDVSLASSIRAEDGSRLAQPLQWSFTTGAPLATLSNQVVFLSDRSGVSNLWAMNPDGSGQRQISAELSGITDYAVAPDGQSLVVGDGARLVALSADGGDRRVLSDEGAVEFDAAYAPDGTSIVFARADPATGAGLGLWTRPARGGDASRIGLPDDLAPPASGSPAPVSSAPLLRAPRYAPDGRSLAFVIGDGRVGVLDLDAGELTTIPFGAVGVPAWLPDSSGLLLTGVPDPVAAPGIGDATRPLAALNPWALDLDPAQLGSMRVASLARGATGITLPGYPAGSVVVARGASGRLAYVTVSGDESDGGLLWLTTGSGGASTPVLRDGGPPVRSVAAGPAGTFLVVRAPGDGSDREHPGGIWQVDAASGDAKPLVADGREARWLP